MMTFDDVGAPPPVRPEPIEPIKTPCVGGPWNGATITHMPDDTKPRVYTDMFAGKAGKYVYHGENSNKRGCGATWVWHKFIHAN